MIGGLDIGGTKSAVILAKVSHDDVIFYGRKEIPTKGTPEEILEKLFSMLSALLTENGMTASALSGIGVSCGGPLDEEKGIILSPPNLPDWDGIEVTRMLRETFGCPAYLMNDANACALAEYHFGAGKGKKNVIFLTFGTGLGAGLILDGKLYSGTNGNAGEAGHIRIAEKGPLGYGKFGSFEGFCSGGGIARQAEIYFRDKSGIKPSAKELFQMAENGDADALAIYSLVGKRFGEGLSLLIDLLNPELIIVGGVFMRAEKYIRASMEEALKKETLAPSLNVVRIVPSLLGEKIGDFGAVAASMK